MLSRIALCTLATLFAAPLWAAECPPLLKQQGQLQQLRSKDSIDLCQRFAGKALELFGQLLLLPRPERRMIHPG